MAAKWIELVTGSLEQKKQYRAYKARKARLPATHREAIDALERYLYLGGIAKGDLIIRMLEDLADLFEQAAADSTPVGAIVGDDPVEFAETFLLNYSEGLWITKERRRLTETIHRITEEEASP